MGDSMSDQGHEQAREWTPKEVEAGLRALLVESLGVKDSEVISSASIVRDLGAESIDFLDLGFKIQQTFGVNFQASEIRSRILAWGTLILPALAEILAARYGVKVTREELEPLEAGGLTRVLEYLRSSRGVALEPDAPGRVGQELVRRLAKEFAAMGFAVSEADEHELLAMLHSSLGARRLIERTLDLLTVEALVNFVCAKLGPRLRDGS